MKRIKIKSGLFASLAALSLMLPSLKEGSLKDIAKPYLGVYECKEARFGEENLLDRFSKLEIELKDKGDCIVYYREKEGKRKSLKGTYSYDQQTETLRFLLSDIEQFKRDFPLKKGVLYITLPIGEKVLYLEFEQK